MIRALAITGPTASGKTALSIELAKALSGEIISCDSMQIYRGMDIGTAKATAYEQALVPHHLIDMIPPTESYSAESYREAAMAAAEDISKRGKLPIFVGGTGLYIDTVIRGVSNSSPESDAAYRERILAEIKTEEDKIRLWERLRLADPETAEKTHYNNIKRVIRALEIYDKTGISKSELDRRTKNAPADIKVGMITLDFHDRELLYSRVGCRVDAMMEEGLLSEVASLYRSGLLRKGSTASEAIGYKEIVSHLEGKCTLSEASEEIKLASRRYAKRQLTWFRHENDAYRIYADKMTGGMRPAEELLDEALLFAGDFLKEESK